uniref:Uncharacterized protein n=1 Tax=Arundo donax TaxID=35708 RepID=A0A0A8ZF04_ARUDO
MKAEELARAAIAEPKYKNFLKTQAERQVEGKEDMTEWDLSFIDNEVRGVSPTLQ